MKRFLLLAVVFCVFAPFAQAADSVTYPPEKLRGYGTLSGTYTPTASGGSVLKITCDDEAKAKLVQAKFLSDLQALPGVNPVAGIAPAPRLFTCLQGPNGFFVAGRSGSTVTLFCAPTEQGVVNEIGRSSGMIYTTDTAVPMNMDRFDKYSFRFYYGPFSTPEGTEMTDYDPSQDFAFDRQNHTGMQVWFTPLTIDNAEGITQMPWTEWVVKTTNKDGLQLGINDGIEEALWAHNRWPEQMIQYQPGFLGDWYGSMNFNEGITSWNALEAKDHILGELQDSLRKLSAYKNITSWLEPHEEMSHGVADLLVEYGPVADAGYRDFLKQKYHDVTTLSQRWYGNATTLKSWGDVKSPELASFLGWGPQAIDLTGTWKVSFDQAFGPEAGSTSLDDSSWAPMRAPNDAIARVTPRKPAVFRRHLDVDPAWRAKNPKVWLYCWDLNDTRSVIDDPNKGVQVYLNGTLLEEKPLKLTSDHWVALDATQSLHDGDNLVAITLPAGMFNYRVYLSPTAPVLYPNLGENENARWVDYYDWNVWFRGNAVRRGAQMIRQIDPTTGLMLMAPNAYQESISGVAKAYGGDFHDTGSMAASFQDDVACLAQGMALPVTVEPGGPAKKVPELKAYFGRWITEGANGIDYFIHQGDVQWFPDMRDTFTSHLPIYTSIGKYHQPPTGVAALYSMRNSGLLNFPWSGGEGYGGSDPHHLGSGQSKWNVRAPLRGDFDADSLMEASFARGDAARYPVIIDTNTSIIDPPLLAQIEKYVRAGGTFVTYVQTGRHTSLVPDSWPIEKLTGYHVTKLMQDTPWQAGALKWADGQKIFSGDWINSPQADGMSLQKMNGASDVQDLAYWKDGSVAIGMRKLGQGQIIEVGCRFTSWGLPDRVDRDIWDYLKKSYNRLTEYGFSTDPNASIFTPQLVATGKLFEQILDWRGVARVPGQLTPQTEDGLLRHFVSNSGLYDIWVVWNQTADRALNTTLHLTVPQPKWAMSLLDGSKTPMNSADLPVHLDPYETAIYLTPRAEVAEAPKDWFELQRRWWQGVGDLGKPFPPVDHLLTRNLTPDWEFSPLPDPASPTAAPASETPKADGKPTQMDFGIFTLPDFPNVHTGMFRKTFTVPESWSHGRVALWIRAWGGWTFAGRGSVYLDGKLLKDCGEDGLEDGAEAVLKAGTTHDLAVVVTRTGGKLGATGSAGVIGSRGPAWIAYHPDPISRQDLAGEWETAKDYLRYDGKTTLPGIGQNANRRMVTIPKDDSAVTVVVHAVATRSAIRDVIINGVFVSRHHHNIGQEINLNITPWVKFGQPNELVLVGQDNVEIKEVSLEFHKKGTYP